MIYYVDSALGRPENDGLSENAPKQSYRDLSVNPGDTVLFKAGSVFRDIIDSPCGEEGKPITWDMYGSGPKPTFLGSVDLHDPALWEETDKHIWACRYPFKNEPCNLIFDFDAFCGVLAWEYAGLNAPHKWHYTHMGCDNPGRKVPESLVNVPKTLYLYCTENPGAYYKAIECATWGERCLLRGSKYINFRNISCKYSGVHAYGQSFVKCVTFDNCEFRFIGGCVWDRIQRIRFGNGLEFWEYGEDVTVTRCYFDEVYDSCTTHQGGKNEKPCVRIRIVNNIFKNYGMGAYELRDLIPVDSAFDGNLCIGAGRGFSLQGETPPRKSELWPQPMGHHLFIWRVYGASENGGVSIKHNIFHEAPYGAAIYSTIAPEAEEQLDLADNIYYKTEDTCLIRLFGKNYGKNDFETYRKETGKDRGSRVENLFAD